MDPATVEAALMHAGLSRQAGRVGMVECLRIECEESQREEVRRILTGLRLHGYDGSELPTGHVVFEDERG